MSKSTGEIAGQSSDTAPDLWDQIWKNHWYGDASRRERRAQHKVAALEGCLKSFRADQNIRVCEIGCGSGHFLRRVAEMIPNLSELSGCDHSPNAILIAKETNNASPIGLLAVCDAARTPFPSNYFNIVFLICVLEHVQDKEPVLEEVNRIVENQGTVIVVYSNARSSFAWERRAKSKFFRWKFGYQDELASSELLMMMQAKFQPTATGVIQGDWDFPILALVDRAISRFRRGWGRYLFICMEKSK